MDKKYVVLKNLQKKSYLTLFFAPAVTDFNETSLVHLDRILMWTVGTTPPDSWQSDR
jgi:hypothetical protein